MKENLAEDVYYSLMGVLEDGAALPWVENIYGPGSECEQAYGRMLEAYERLRGRLGVAEEDEDVEVIINSLLDIEKILCVKMFEYGVQYERTVGEGL